MEEESTKSILIDVTSLFDQYSKRGIGRYTREILKVLIKEVLAEKGWKIMLLGFNDLEINLIEMGFSKFAIEEIESEIEFFSLGDPYLSSIKNVRKWKDIDSIIYETEPDVYWAMHFERGLPTTRFLNHQYTDLKTVVTVHDVIPLVNNKFSQKGKLQNYIKGWFYRLMWTGVKNADLVLTCSDFSKNDLIGVGKVPESIVQRVYLGVNDGFFKSLTNFEDSEVQEVKKRFGVEDKDYFFYDSGLEQNKGIDSLLEILKAVFENKSKSSFPTHFVITGGDFYSGVGSAIRFRSPRGREVLKKIESMGLIDRFIATGKLSEEELQIMLRQAHTYIYLSEYEGFGFGPVQAMASEIPAIVSNKSCLPEITDNGTFLVDTDSIEEAKSRIISYLKDTKLREDFIKKGKKVAQKYKWEKTAEETWDYIKALVSNKD